MTRQGIEANSKQITAINNLRGIVANFSPQAMSPKQGCLVFVHKEGESLEAGSFKIQLVLGDEKIVREPPHNAKIVSVGETSEVPEVIVKLP